MGVLAETSLKTYNGKLSLTCSQKDQLVVAVFFIILIYFDFFF